MTAQVNYTQTVHSGFETREEDTPKQEQSVAPQTGPRSNNFFFQKIHKLYI